MKKTLITAGFILAFASPVLADDTPMIDTNTDGFVTLEELQAAYPTLENADQLFATIDTDANGALSKTELTAAFEAKLLPES